MVKIRLARGGAKKDPFYRIVAIESTRKRGGKPLAVLGFWHPKGQSLEIKRSEIEKLKKLGAQVSPTVTKLINK